MFSRGDNRWVYRNSPLGVRPLAYRAINKNLFSMNGMLYERDRFGTVRPLYLDRRSGALMNMREPGTRLAVARLYNQSKNRLVGEFGNIVNKFLNNVGLVKPGSASPSVSSPESVFPERSSRRSGPEGIFADTKGKHGNGSVTSTRGVGQKKRARVGTRAKLPDSVCTDLNHAICQSNPNDRNERRAVEDFKQGIVRGFVSQNRLGGSFLGQMFSGILTNPGRFSRAYQTFTGFLAGKIPGVERAVTTAKGAFLASINRQPLSPQAKAAMRDKVAKVKIRLTPNFSNPQALAGFVQNCGADGMAPGAFAVPPLNEVVVCPGLALEAAKRGGDLTGHLTHVLAHEVGHHCGCDVDPAGRPGPFFNQYDKMRACYQVHYKVLPSMSGEIAADFWGVESLIPRLKGKSKQAAFDMMVDAMRPICGSPNDGVHPSGRFRINVTLGRHPEVRQVLGCDGPTLERPACLMDGAVPRASDRVLAEGSR